MIGWAIKLILGGLSFNIISAYEPQGRLMKMINGFFQRSWIRLCEVSYKSRNFL